MAKQIKWTNRAVIDRTNIYKYWLERNKTNIYSEKLEELFNKSAEIISVFPNIGSTTNYRDVFAKIVKDYKVFYRVKSDSIEILRAP